MPAYEFSVLLKVLPRPEMTAALKRVGTLLLDQGVVLQRLENLGEKNLPYRMTQDNLPIHKGHFFVYTLMGSHKILSTVCRTCKRDMDILRIGFCEYWKELDDECTLEEELKPPAVRASVQKLIHSGQKYKERRAPRYKHERDYTWFDPYM